MKNKELDKAIESKRKNSQDAFDYEEYSKKEKEDNERFKANFNRARKSK